MKGPRANAVGGGKSIRLIPVIFVMLWSVSSMGAAQSTITRVRTPGGDIGALGTVGVIATSTIPWMEVTYPMDKASTAEEYGRRGLTLGLPAECLFPLSMFWPAVPYVAGGMGAAAAFGAGVGYATGVGDKKIAHGTVAYHQFASQASFQETLRMVVTRGFQEKTAAPVKIVPKPFLEGHEEEWSQMSCVMAGTLAWVPEGYTAATYLAEQQVDTVLELRVNGHGLTAAPGINPVQQFYADVEVRLVRLADRAELARYHIDYKGAKGKFAWWMEGNAKRLVDEFVLCTQMIGAQVVEELTPAINYAAAQSGLKVAKGHGNDEYRMTNVENPGFLISSMKRE